MMFRFQAARCVLIACLLPVSGTTVRANQPAPAVTKRAFYNPTPPYPYAARHFNLGFTVVVRITFAATGEVKEVKVVRSCGDTGLDNYVQRFIREHWRSYTGKEVTGTQTLDFVIRRPGSKI